MTGETACADSWGRALAAGEISLSIPCYAERRYGGVADDELAMALPPAEFETGIAGLRGLDKAGLRYPILPYSTGMAQMAAAGFTSAGSGRALAASARI